jgi:hypothetical protein
LLCILQEVLKSVNAEVNAFVAGSGILSQGRIPPGKDALFFRSGAGKGRVAAVEKLRDSTGFLALYWRSQ